MTTLKPDYHAHVMAVQRVEERLRKVTAALDAAGVSYAVIGGNAVAAWVARIDPGATRNTKDVDLLVDRAALGDVGRSMTDIGFIREDVLGVTHFLDPDDPSARRGVRLVWAGVRVRPEYNVAAPEMRESERDPQGFRVLELNALVRMKLTSFRLIDQVHIQDLIRVALITIDVRASLPDDSLRRRLDEIIAATDPDDPH